jgi:mannose-6-phosphate isomerase-like protein (cupin superfamily)
MTSNNDRPEMTRRGVLGGIAATAAIGLSASSASASPMPLDPQALAHLVVSVDDVPTAEFDWGTLKWMLSAEQSPGAEQTLGICQIFPGKVNPLHYHPNCEEILYMIAGRGRHRLGDQSVELTPGMAIRIPQNVHHNLENIGWETILCLVSFSSGNRKMVHVK